MIKRPIEAEITQCTFDKPRVLQLSDTVISHSKAFTCALMKHPEQSVHFCTKCHGNPTNSSVVRSLYLTAKCSLEVHIRSGEKRKYSATFLFACAKFKTQVITHRKRILTKKCVCVTLKRSPETWYLWLNKMTITHLFKNIRIKNGVT